MDINQENNMNDVSVFYICIYIQTSLEHAQWLYIVIMQKLIQFHTKRLTQCPQT